MSAREAIEPQLPRVGAWTRPRSRRDVLKLGGLIAAGATAAPWLAACAGQDQGPTGSDSGFGASQTPSGRITVLTIGGSPLLEPALQQVYEGFRAENPGIEWDIRALPGGGPEWDRLARAAIASGEPVGLVEINGQQVRGWVRDGLLADLGADPSLEAVLARVPRQFHLGGPGETAVRAFPLAVTRGVHTTGLFYNKALLDQVGVDVPRTIADLEAMVQPLSAIGVAPLVHCSGDVFFNQVLITWMLPMIAERGGDPIEFADRTVRGEIGYDSPEWIEALQTIANLRTSGVLLEGSGATDYATMQQLFLQGRVATTFNGSWMLPQILAGTPTGPFDLHVAPPPLVDGASRARPILAWTGYGLPATQGPSHDAVSAFLEYASRPDVDRAVVEGSQTYSPIAASNTALEDAAAREFLPMLRDAITPLDWLWEPEITAELDSQVQALVKGDTDPASAGSAVQRIADELRSTGRSYYA